MQTSLKSYFHGTSNPFLTRAKQLLTLILIGVIVNLVHIKHFQVASNGFYCHLSRSRDPVLQRVLIFNNLKTLGLRGSDIQEKCRSLASFRTLNMQLLLVNNQ